VSHGSSACRPKNKHLAMVKPNEQIIFNLRFCSDCGNAPARRLAIISVVLLAKNFWGGLVGE